MNNIYIPPVVKNLLIINILFFAATWIFMKLEVVDLNNILAVYYFDSPKFKVWQPITYMFMHGGIAHIFFNMFALYSFGSLLENRWGAKKFIIFYFVTGVGALALQWAVQAFEVHQILGSIISQNKLNFNDLYFNTNDNSPMQIKTLYGIYFGGMVGASGAIFGLLAAFGILYPNAELLILFIPVPVKAKYIIPIYILVELSLGVAQFQGDSVAHYAHLGGALIGFILVKIWKDKDTFYTYYE